MITVHKWQVLTTVILNLASKVSKSSTFMLFTTFYNLTISCDLLSKGVWSFDLILHFLKFS